MANPENEKKLKTRILVWLGTTLGPILLRFCYNTNKWDHHEREHFEDIIKKKKPVIVASWHSTLLTVFMGLSNKNYYGLAGNHHPDAEIISRVGKKLGWNVIRGSSTDGGKKAYDEMLAILKKPKTIFAITPDGPQGPAKIPKAGTIRAAQKQVLLLYPLLGNPPKGGLLSIGTLFMCQNPLGPYRFFMVNLYFLVKTKTLKSVKTY